MLEISRYTYLEREYCGIDIHYLFPANEFRLKIDQSHGLIATPVEIVKKRNCFLTGDATGRILNRTMISI